MRIEMVSGFLLPAGVWLIVSAGMPLQAQRRLASTTLIALAVSLLSFVAFGFALMYGGIGATMPEFAASLNAPIALRGAQDTWIFAGASGFLLDAATQTAVLALFIQALPLVLTCAVLMAGVLAQRARLFAQIILVVLTCGIVLPLAGCWLWANGWLAMLGANDAGKLSVIGLVAGGAGLAWLVTTPRRNTFSQPELPITQLPARAIAGVLLVLAGMAGILISINADTAMRQFVNSSITVAIALITAGAYNAFTTRDTETLSASRAMLAATFMASAGAATWPAWMMPVTGVTCGLLATVGYYWVNEKRKLDDESAIVTAVLLPALAGMLIAGVFASSAATLIAQVIAAAIIAVLAYAPARLALWFAGLARWPVLLPQAVTPTLAMAEAPAHDAMIEPASVIDEALAQANPEPEITTTEEKTVTEAYATALAGTTGSMSNTPSSAPASPQKPRGLMGWLRRNQTADESPKQPRKVAYPYRMGGRRMAARPIAGDGTQADSAPSIDAS